MCFPTSHPLATSTKKKRERKRFYAYIYTLGFHFLKKPASLTFSFFSVSLLLLPKEIFFFPKESHLFNRDETGRRGGFPEDRNHLLLLYCFTPHHPPPKQPPFEGLKPFTLLLYVHFTRPFGATYPPPGANWTRLKPRLRRRGGAGRNGGGGFSRGGVLFSVVFVPCPTLLRFQAWLCLLSLLGCELKGGFPSPGLKGNEVLVGEKEGEV